MDERNNIQEDQIYNGMPLIGNAVDNIRHKAEMGGEQTISKISDYYLEWKSKYDGKERAFVEYGGSEQT